jgi:purine catabolism regulator
MHFHIVEEDRMKFPCWAIQSTAFFKDAEVIAGYAGLDHIVEHINIIDTLYGYKPFLKQNAFVILSGWDVFNSLDILRGLMLEFKEVGVAAIAVYEYEELFTKGYSQDLIDLGDQLTIPIFKMQMPHTFQRIIQYFSNNVFIDFYRKFVSKEEIQNQFYLLHKMGKMDRFAQTLWEVTQKDVVIRLKDYDFNYSDIDIERILDNRENWTEEPLETQQDYSSVSLSSYYLILDDVEYYWVGSHYAFDKSIDWFAWLFYEDELDENTIALFRYATRALTLEQEERIVHFQRVHEKSLALLLNPEGAIDKSKNAEYNRLLESSGRGRVFVCQGTIDDDKYNAAYCRMAEYLNEILTLNNTFLLGNYNKEYFILTVQVKDRETSRHIASILVDICSSLMEQNFSTEVGVGDYPEAADITRSFKNGQRALFWAKKMKCRYILFEELGMLRYIYDEEEYHWVEEIKERYVDILKTFDIANNGNLLHTMMVMVKNLWSRNQAAKELFVHSNTVQYRLEKIQSIFGVDFQERDIRYDVEIALSLEKLLSENSTPKVNGEKRIQ